MHCVPEQLIEEMALIWQLGRILRALAAVLPVRTMAAQLVEWRHLRTTKCDDKLLCAAGSADTGSCILDTASGSESRDLDD